jgi:hypothetical protein
MLTALYDYIIARANLGRAIGDDVVGSRPASPDAPRDGKAVNGKDAKDAVREGSNAAR